MSIVRVNSAGWGVGDKVTSAQMNGVDINGTYAVDKRAGQTDTIASLLSMSGAGRIVDTVSNGPDANTTFTADGGNQTIRISGLTAARTYTLSATNAVTGDCIYVYVESSVTFDTMIVDQASNPLYLAGNSAQADGQWASFIYISGWRLFQGGQGSRFKLTTFTSSGQTVAVPRGVTGCIAVGCGGGGGGGAGGSFGTYVASRVVAGGGGGGGAFLSTQFMPLVPGATLTATIGAGGAGGGSGSAGSDGTTSSLTDGTNLVYFNGAGGGQGGYFADASASQALLVNGGQPVAQGNQLNTYTIITLVSGSPTAGYPTGISQGGYGISANLGAGKNGNGTPQNIGGGGTGGSSGTTTSTYYGGGAGGGGGNGPFGGIAVGGNGGNGNSGGAGGAGSAAGSAAANSGGGGGGGGAGGMGTGGSGTAGAGGSGGSGKILVYWVK